MGEKQGSDLDALVESTRELRERNNKLEKSLFPKRRTSGEWSLSDLRRWCGESTARRAFERAKERDEES